MLGQRASSHTVCSPSSRIMPLSCTYVVPPGALTLSHPGFRTGDGGREAPAEAPAGGAVRVSWTSGTATDSPSLSWVTLLRKLSLAQAWRIGDLGPGSGFAAGV